MIDNNFIVVKIGTDAHQAVAWQVDYMRKEIDKMNLGIKALVTTHDVQIEVINHRVQWAQILLQLHDKQVITTEELKKHLGL